MYLCAGCALSFRFDFRCLLFSPCFFLSLCRFLCIFFFLLCSRLVCLLRCSKRNTHTHTLYGSHGLHLSPIRVAVLLHKHIASVWCLLLVFFNDISLAHSCRYHHLYRLLRKQWSHGYWWRTKRTDWIRHSVQPKWPGISSDQTDLLQLHSSYSL